MTTATSKTKEKKEMVAQVWHKNGSIYKYANDKEPSIGSLYMNGKPKSTRGKWELLVITLDHGDQPVR